MTKLSLHFKILIIISAFFISSKKIHSQWIIAGDLTGVAGPRPQVSVVDENTAFVTGGETTNATYKTTNGGTTWIQLNTGAFKTFWSIWAKDANTVFAGDNGGGGVGSNGVEKIYKTTNGGFNWILIDSTAGENTAIRGIKFSISNPSFGIAVGEANNGEFTIYKTRNGGNTWTKDLLTGYPGVHITYSSLNVVDSLFYAFGTGLTPPAIIITSDGGATWNLRNLNLPSGSGPFTRGIAFKDDKLTGISESFSLPIIARTTNGGVNWTNIDVGNGVTSGVGSIMRWIEGTNTCYLTSSDPGAGVLKSINGGLNWTQMTTSNTGFFNFDTKKIGSNIYGYANSSLGNFGGDLVLKMTDFISGINQISELVPYEYRLSQNYPNPFNPVTNLEFGISKLGFVSLKIYDMLGKEVATLVNTNLNPGTYKYNYDASGLSSGIYFYKLTVDGNIIDTKRMMLLK